MHCTLSTSYFAGSDLTPLEMAEQVATLGFDGVELGYFTREEDWPEWQRALNKHHLTVDSIHAFAPVQVGMPSLGPEIFAIADPNPEERKMGVCFLRKSLAFAQTTGAKAIVLHAGRVNMKPEWYSFKTETACRAKNVSKNVDAIRLSLDEVLPDFLNAGVKLCIENLPGADAYPNANEFITILEQFPEIHAWYDIGHGELRERVGLESINEALTTLGAYIGGCHIHDVQAPLTDHCAPGTGEVKWDVLKPFLVKPDIIQVFEPRPTVTLNELQLGLQLIRKVWYD